MAYIDYKKHIDKLISQMKSCKNNKKRENLNWIIKVMQRDIQNLYNNGDFVYL